MNYSSQPRTDETSAGLSLTVVIPALDEGPTISKVLSQLSVTTPAAQVIVIDGGSSDKTLEMALRANATVILEPRRGYGRAIRTGIRAASAEYYAIVDADDTYDLSSLPKMLRLAATGKLVVGRRDGFEQRSMSLTHLIGNMVLSAVYRLLYKQSVRDTQSGFKVFPAPVARELHEDGMTLSSEILVVGQHMGYDVAEVSVKYRIRDSGSKSKFSFWLDGTTVLSYLILSRFRRRKSD